MSFLFLLGLLVSFSLFGEPGNEAPLESKSLEATLYLSQVYRSPRGDTSLELLWIPSDVEAKCVENTVADCSERDRCLNYPLAQQCSPDYSHCHPVVNEPCGRYGVTVETKAIARHSPPYRVLTTTYTIPESLIPTLKRWKLVPELGQTKKVDRLTKEHTVLAKIKWEHWTNGENVMVLNLLNQP